MSSKIEIHILGMKKWSFPDEKTGEIREGVTVFVAQDNQDSSGDTLGLEVMKMTAPIYVYERAKSLKIPFPADCQASVNLKLGAGGKAVMQIQDISFE